MSIFSLPKIPLREDIEEIINASFTMTPSRPLNRTLSTYLNDIKTQIDSKQDEWDRCKKLTNPYEYIHTAVPNTKQSVCRLKPLSRSFFKMIEIYNLVYLNEVLPKPCKIFYLAEGPGGFIEAMHLLRGDTKDSHHAISLIDNNDQSVPGWRKSQIFFEKCKGLEIEYGVDGTGNILNPGTLVDLYNRHYNTVDLVTGDGGFNFSSDFNHQESASIQLIIAQIAYSIAIQKQGGTAVIKFFDTFTAASLDLIYFLTNAYTEFTWVKPCTSRYANSERYAVCQGFRLQNVKSIVSKFQDILVQLSKGVPIERILTCDIPYIVLSKVEEYNAMFGQQQIESIANTLNLIDNIKHEKLDAIKKSNIGKCINWCQKHKLPYNKTITATNTFISMRPQPLDVPTTAYI